MFFNKLILFLIPLSLNAQSIESVISAIQTKFLTVNDLQADFTQKINYSNSDNTVKLSGKFYFKKENKLRIEVQDREIISDGINIWNYDESNDKLIISLYEDEYTTFSLPTIINVYPDLCDKQMDRNERGEVSIKFIPNEDQLNFKTAVISVTSDYNIDKIEITDYNEMKFTFELESIETNSNLSDQLFIFKPAEGVEIIDLR